MSRFIVLLAVLLLATASAAIDGKHPPSAASVKPAAELNESAISGDFVTAEGLIADLRGGNGSYVVATLEDDSGSVLAAVPEYIRRQIESEPGVDPIGVRVRVSGVWDHKALDEDTQGIRVQNVVVLER